MKARMKSRVETTKKRMKNSLRMRARDRTIRRMPMKVKVLQYNLVKAAVQGKNSAEICCRV